MLVDNVRLDQVRERDERSDVKIVTVEPEVVESRDVLDIDHQVGSDRVVS
jgi:hypothetical protein